LEHRSIFVTNGGSIGIDMLYPDLNNRKSPPQRKCVIFTDMCEQCKWRRLPILKLRAVTAFTTTEIKLEDM